MSAIRTIEGAKTVSSVISALSKKFPLLRNVIDGVIISMKAGFGATNTLKVAMLGLWDVIKAHPVMTAITALTGLVAIVNMVTQAEKEREKAAHEQAQRSQEAAEKAKEEANSLDELIDKYKQLKSSENLNSSAREEIRNIQNEITNLVGTQADNLDLVNGKLDDELDKLKNASKEYLAMPSNLRSIRKLVDNTTAFCYNNLRMNCKLEVLFCQNT